MKIFSSFFNCRLVLFYSTFLICFILTFARLNAVAQSFCPNVSITPSNSCIYGGCTTLNATVQGTVETTTYSVATTPYVPFSYNTGTPVLVNIDDSYSDTITLPFCFQFYGNTYDKIFIGSNGILTFDLTQIYCGYDLTYSSGIPDTALPLNSIMGPYQDIDPTNMGNINWQIVGVAPCRAFVVSFDSIPYFGDPNSIDPPVCLSPLFATSQIVLYETTNIIDIFIKNKTFCTDWNNGLSIEGIQNATGTAATAVPGRNNTVWSATNNAVRFTPTGSPQYNLTWYSPANIPIGNASNISVCPTVATTYTATVVNNTCNGPITVSATATVNINDIQSINISTFAPCTGNTGTVTATVIGGSPPYTCLWNPGGQTTQTVTGLSTGTYTVTATGANGCTITDSIEIIVSSPVSFSFSSINHLNCFGNNSGSASVNVLSGAPPYTYLWNPSGQTTSTATGLSGGTYTVTITDSFGCSHSDNIPITSPPPLTHSFSSIGVNCFGDNNGSTTVNVSGGTPSYTYLWSNGQTNSGISNLPAGNYGVLITDTNGCLDSSMITITQPTELIASIVPGDTSLCLGSGITENIIANGGTGSYTYLWMPGGTTTSAITVSLSANTTYNIGVTDANGCTTQLNTNITIAPVPLANFSISPGDVVLFPETICFTADSTNANTWLWDFGDNTTTSGNPACHDYSMMGTYCVTLREVNNSGCIDTAEKCVTELDIIIPNVFSPNGDGENDEFFLSLVAGGITYFRCDIFDRWGLKMAELTSPKQVWDGRTLSGSLASDGTYFFVLSVSWRDKWSIRKEGFLTLAR